MNLMSKSGRSLVILLLLSIAAAPQAAVGNLIETRNLINSNGTLILTTSSVGQRMCSGDAQVSVMQLRLKLHYTNTGQGPIILYKGSSLVSTITVSKTAEDALAGRYEVSLSPTVLTSNGQRITDRPDKQFVILQHGASFDAEALVAIPFVTTTLSTVPGTVTTGSHFLRVQVVTWPGTSELGKRLQNQWKKKGYLWIDVIQSAPMQFSIDPQARLENCV